MILLKQSTAVTVVLGPFVDDTDGKTAETALTISQADIRLSKNGGAYAQTNNSAGATHMEAGKYSVPLDTTDTNTLGRLRVDVAESGALPVWEVFMIMPANVWDSLFGSDKLQVDLVEWLGTAAATPTVAGVPEVDVTHQAGVAVTPLVRRGTAQAGAAGSVTLDASASSTTDFYKGCLVYLVSGTGVGQARYITAYNGTTKVATVDANWATNPDSTSVFELFPGSAGAAPPTNFSAMNLDSSGRMLLQPTQSGVTIPTVTTLTNAPSDPSGVTTLLSRLSALRAGYLDNLSAGAVATAAALGVVDDLIDTEITALATALTVVDGIVDAIKLKTDSLTFTVAGVLDSNIQRINDVAVTGDGSGTPFNV